MGEWPSSEGDTRKKSPGVQLISSGSSFGEVGEPAAAAHVCICLLHDVGLSWDKEAWVSQGDIGLLATYTTLHKAASS